MASYLKFLSLKFDQGTSTLAVQNVIMWGKTLLTSQTINTENTAVSYSCDECDYVAIGKTKLNIHIKIKHIGRKYNCDQRDFTATYKVRVKEH